MNLKQGSHSLPCFFSIPIYYRVPVPMLSALSTFLP